MKKALLFSTIAAVGLMVAQANAAVQVTMSANVDAAFTPDFSTTVPYNASLNPATTGVVYEIPIYFQMDNLPSGESFGNLAFNITWDGSITPDAFGYAGSTATYTVGPNHVGYYGGNADVGTSTTDLQDIVAYFPTGTASSQRAAAGNGSPFLLGNVYFDLPADATGISHVNITPITSPSNQFSENISGTAVQDTTATLTGTSLTFVVPEPASLSLLALGALGLVARRRRA